MAWSSFPALKPDVQLSSRIVKGTLAGLFSTGVGGGHRLPALGVAVPSDADAVPSHKPMSWFRLRLTAKRLICCPFTSVRAGAD
jgi:hypothetical protein